MPNRILTLRRKRNETSEICIDFSVCYDGTIAPSNGSNGNTYALGNGTGVSGETSHAISICYNEDADNRVQITISEDGQLLDTIVVEDSDEDFIVVEDSDEDFIVVEDSDEDFIKIKIPTSKDTLNLSTSLMSSN